MTTDPEAPSLSQIFRIFLQFGLLGFGGPPAHIAMMEEEFVQKRGMVDGDHFTGALAVCGLLPGPTSTQMAIWLGYAARGWIGAIIAGVAFIAPAFCLLLVLSWAYFGYGAQPAAAGLLAGIRPAVIAIVLVSCYRLGKSAVWPGRNEAVRR